MNTCKKCNNILPEDANVCPYCGTRVRNLNDNKLNNAFKVAITGLTVIIPIVGIILGVIFMTNESEDYKSYGKAILILAIIMMALPFLCCLAGGINDILDYESYFYYLPDIIDEFM